MKKLGTLLWVLTILFVVSSIVFAVQANHFYQEYQRYRSYDIVDKTYGDVCRASAVIEAVAAFLTAFAAHGVVDLNRKLEVNEENQQKILSILEDICPEKAVNHHTTKSGYAPTNSYYGKRDPKAVFRDVEDENDYRPKEVRWVPAPEPTPSPVVEKQAGSVTSSNEQRTRRSRTERSNTVSSQQNLS